MAEQINLASLIISIIILIVVIILIFMVCCYYNTNNNSTKSIQNPQALAAAALYKNANKNKFFNGGTCNGWNNGKCCWSDRANASGHCSFGTCLAGAGPFGNVNSGWVGYSSPC